MGTKHSTGCIFQSSSVSGAIDSIGEALTAKDGPTMNKRMFLKLSAAVLGGSSGARLFGRAPDEPASGGQLTNWAGNHRYGTDNLHQLTSIEQVQEFVKDHASLKVLGTRHCFNGIADSSHALISL